MNPLLLWKRYQDFLCIVPPLKLSLDISRMNFGENFFSQMEPQMRVAFAAMEELEKGGIANPDEKRMVGHYWLRAPELAPNPEIRQVIEKTIQEIKLFADKIHHGVIQPERGGRFTDLLIIGIGGSALGPQFVSHALGHPKKDKLRIWFFDNTDPDGMELTLSQILKHTNNSLATLLTVVTSKSGGTKETRNGQLFAQAAYKKNGLSSHRHMVAITGEGSELSQIATREHWLAQFPMWDWVGGRTSELSAVGLLPAALQGINVDELLDGACLMDRATRLKVTSQNPAALLALMWFYATDGRGAKDMVVLPYKDRLLLFSRYLQQLLMESLGKEFDLAGKRVNQGLAVYGNKGSTDQHAYIQQLRDGVANFFVVFIQVLQDSKDPSHFVEPGVTPGDYLLGFLLGTREALYEKGRESMTITVRDVSPCTVGALIALFERAVGFYASLIGINAYHQPGVEAGKKAATAVLALQQKILAEFVNHKNQHLTADQIAQAIGAPESVETVFQILQHLALNSDRAICSEGAHPSSISFWLGS